MSAAKNTTLPKSEPITRLRLFKRFTLAQRWEHTLLMISTSMLLLTGLPQKYQLTAWSQAILSTPERANLLRQIHLIAAVVLTLEVIYHLGHAIYLMFRRRLPGAMLPSMQDIRDAWQMIKYLLFITKEKPAFGRYNFEQKVTYWFLFFGIGIMVASGFIQWFPELFTRWLPGAIVPAAKLAHSTEAIVAAIFVVLWHVYHVHIERLNISIFTGYLNEKDMRTYHEKEYQRLSRSPKTMHNPAKSGEKR